MRRRWVFATAAATLGAAALVVAPLASRAPAGEPLPTYIAHGIAKGVDVSFALRPNIFDPLLEFAAGYSDTKIESSGGGGSNALASALYPGSLVIGARGCAGMPGTTQAAYPPDTTKDPAKRCGTRQPQQAETVLPCWKELQQLADGCKAIVENPSSPLKMGAGDLKTQAALGASHSSATIQRVTFAPSAEVRISVSSITTTSDSVLTAAGIQQATVSRSSGISIVVPGLAIDIGSLVSRAVSTSDGDVASAVATLTFGDVTVTIGGAKHRAFIDNKGVHVGELSSPAPSQVPEDIGTLSQSVAAKLDQAGVEVRAGSPVQLEDGGRAESSIGGLVIALNTARPPGVPVPPLPVAIPTVPNHCFGNEAPPIKGFCLGQGVLPIPPGDSATGLSIGGADALAIGAHGFTFNPVLPTLPPLDGDFGGGFTGGGGGGGVIGGVQPTSSPAPGFTQPPVQQARLLGLVAKLPSSALVIAGLLFMVLAIGLAWAPSLRP